MAKHAPSKIIRYHLLFLSINMLIFHKKQKLDQLSLNSPESFSKNFINKLFCIANNAKIHTNEF